MQPQKPKKKFLASLFERLSSTVVQDMLVNFLERQAIKAIFKKLVISGGIKGWLIQFVVGELIEKSDEHVIEPLFNKIGWVSDTLHGKAIYKRKENAENRDDWRDTVRNG